MDTTRTGPGYGLLALLVTLAAPALADPSWWSDPSTSIWATTPQNVENGAPVNLGQLKHVADRARRHLDGTLAKAGGAGAAVTAMCKFTQTDNYAPATVGQLKNVAKVFYDRLGEVGYNWQTGSFGTPSTPYPWTGTINAENQAPCNVGQMKNLFTVEISPAFLAIDGDLDGIPSWWEKAYGLDADSSADASFDADVDLLTNAQEYQIGLNPQSSQSGGAGQPSDYQKSLALPAFDTDRDGLGNAGDAVPTDRLLMFPPVAESRYALIDVGPGTAHSVNASGQVLRACPANKLIYHKGFSAVRRLAAKPIMAR